MLVCCSQLQMVINQASVNIAANMKDPKISIIVPVYQAEAFLSRCLDSIVNQTFQDWECILVDDGSKDRSGAICNEYALLDSRFKVFHQANCGASATRQVALDASKGEFIAFADSDDWVETRWLEKLYQKMTEDNVDMVICDYERIFVDKTMYYAGCGYSMNNTDLLVDLVSAEYWGILWNKLIRKECFLRYQVTFHPEMFYMGDLYVISKLLINPIKVSHLPEALYHYDSAINNHSIIKTKNNKYFHSIIIYINTFSPILSDSRFDNGWYYRKKSMKKDIFRMGGHCKYDIKDVYPEINERLIKELSQSRWVSINRCMMMCLQGHQTAGYLLCGVLKKLTKLVHK